MAVKAVPAYSEKHLNQNWQENAASLPQKAGSVEPQVFMPLQLAILANFKQVSQ
nr:hypothetical protein [Serratia fonticola]